jgi:integrase/recombinase XerD
MNTKKISVIFLIARSRQNQSGRCSVRCRITFLQQRYEFATGLFIIPSSWNSKLQLVKPPNEENTNINNQLSLIKSKINQAFLLLQIKKQDFDVVDIYKIYKGEKPKAEKAVLEVYQEYMVRLKKLLDKEIQQVTYNKYMESFNHLKNFIKYKFKTNDIKLKDIKNNFLDEFEFYLKIDVDKKKGLAQSTINKVIQRFRRIIKFAISEGYLEKDPFMLYKAKSVSKNIVFLTKSELNQLEKHQFKTERINNVKLLFVFCCYTGLAFKEMSLLKKRDIITGYDNNLWIVIKRSKTLREYKIPLLPKAREIIAHFDDTNSDFCFPNISNQKFNEYLKEIADVVGLQKTLTHHIARKTFASTVLLNNGVPMEVVSELLGHSKITTTQGHYAKVVQSQISSQISILTKKLEGLDKN